MKTKFAPQKDPESSFARMSSSCSWWSCSYCVRQVKPCIMVNSIVIFLNLYKTVLISQVNKFYRVSKKTRHPQYVFISVILKPFCSFLFLIPYTSPIQEKKHEWSISSAGANGAEIFVFFVLGRSSEKVYIQGENYFGNCDVYVSLFKFTSFLDCSYLFLSDRNLYHIHNVSKEYGI